MPLYDAHCPGCGWEGEALQAAEARGVARCDECGGPLEVAAFGRPAIHGFTEHFDQGLGEVVKSRAHKKALLKEKGFIETGGEMPSEPTRPPRSSALPTREEFMEGRKRAKEKLKNAEYRNWIEHPDQTDPPPL